MKAVVFDFDGTLVDTEWPEFEAWSAKAAELGVELPLDLWLDAVGKAFGSFDFASWLAGEAGISVHEIRSWEEDLRLRLTTTLPLRDGMARLLDELADLPLAVASSSPHDWVDPQLARLGISDRFQAVLCKDDVAKAKPAPDLYLAACSALSVAPYDAVAIEDSATGARSAVEAGLCCVVVPNGVTQNMDLSHAAFSTAPGRLRRSELERVSRSWRARP